MIHSHQNNTKCWKEIGVFGNSTCEKLSVWGHCRHCPEYSKAGRRLLDRPIPDGAIEEWTEIIALEKESQAQGTISVVIFRLNSEWLAFKTIYFQEAVEAKPLHHVPFRSNNIFLGLVNISGELLMSISAADLLGIAEQANIAAQAGSKPKRMVVVSKDSQRYVVPVDEFYGVTRIAPEEIHKTPATLSKSPNAFSSGVFYLQDLSVGLIDENVFFQTLRTSLVW